MLKSVRTYAIDTGNPTVAPSTDSLSALLQASDTVVDLNGTGGYAGIQNGEVISIEGEPMKVLSGGGTLSLTVERDSTIAVNHAKDTVVNIPGYIPFNLLPISAVPNQDFYIYKSTADTNYVMVNCFLGDTFRNGSTSRILLDNSDALGTLHIHAPAGSNVWIQATGGGGGTSASGGVAGVPAPPVVINPPAEVIFRSDHRVEVDVEWTADSTATPQNFAGVAVYLEDPDISSGANEPMDGSMPLDGTSQVSGEWAPVYVNDSVKSPAVIFLDSTMGSSNGESYQKARDVRIYLAAYGPFSQPILTRATSTTPAPTPNIKVNIPLGRGQGESGQEYAFLVTNVSVTVTTDYNRPDPNYYLQYFYDPPDPATPVPPGMNRFGGCRIIFVNEDADGNPIFPGTDTGTDVPVAQSSSGYKSPVYTPGPLGTQFRCYFCSEDDSQPLGTHINSLVEGVTPYALAVVPPLPSTPDVTGFTLTGQKYVWLLDGTFIEEATLSWDLPTVDEGSIRYAGVYLYLVKVTGTAPLTPFPQTLSGQQANKEDRFFLEISNIPRTAEVWTIAAISVSVNGVLADTPGNYGQPGFHSPTVTLTVGPPTPGSAGGGLEYAPSVTIDPGAHATANETVSADGVGMVNFNVGTWHNPSDNKFGGAQIAMVVNHDPTKPTYWSVPLNATSFQTPTMPSFGNIGATVPVDFYVVSDDPQGHKNSLVPGTTPVISYNYTPSGGQVIPARDGWFDTTQFDWVGDKFTAESFSAKIVQVGKTLVVGGAPGNTFGGSDNGQIAVKNSSGVLRGWIGEQQPGQGSSQPLWGAWFGQIWIGGTSPLDAPIWVDGSGIIQVGGIAAAPPGNSTYPYISIRDDHGIEKGRIGAKINVSSGTPGDSVGSTPPSGLTSGAWFTQLAIGGSNLSNWNVLVTPDATNPLGSQFQIRNVNLFQVDYAAQSGTPANNQYQLKFGNSVWVGAGMSNWQFPGITVYEVDNSQSLFGAVYISRGVILRGHQNQGYPVLVSLVTFNGQSTGSDSPSTFWGELAMYSPTGTGGSRSQTVHITSGSNVSGNPSLTLRDSAYPASTILFQADESGNVTLSGSLQGPGATEVQAIALKIKGYGTVIDSTGAWKGKSISGGQTPWTSDIAGAGFSLTGVGTLRAASFQSTNAILVSGSTTKGNKTVIDSDGVFVGSGMNIGGFGVTCGSVNTNGASPAGSVTCGLLNASNNVIAGGAVNPGSLIGDGWIVGIHMGVTQEIGCASLSVGGTVQIDSSGYIGPAVTIDGQVLAHHFGIHGYALGWPGQDSHGNNITGTFVAGSKTIYVVGGLIVNVI